MDVSNPHSEENEEKHMKYVKVILLLIGGAVILTVKVQGTF